MAKLWAGRFQKETDLVVNDFNSSILFDCRLYREDIMGSIAHATMLGKQGIIEEHESEKIVEGLKGILEDIEADARETIRSRSTCACTSKRRSARLST